MFLHDFSAHSGKMGLACSTRMLSLSQFILILGFLSNAILVLCSTVGHKMDWNDYHKLEDIDGYLSYVASKYPETVQLISIGKSYEGRSLNLVRISSNLSSRSNPAIWIDGGIHAREWISPAVVTYFINQLVEVKSNRDMLQKVDYYVIPVVNPDGYKYSIETDSEWRKNRRKSDERADCVGTDLNRNFDIKWMETGSSNNSCSNTFAGSSPFSEPESLAVANFLTKNVAQIKMYLTFHNHGQYLLVPYGYEVEYPKDFKDLLSLAEKAADQTKKYSYIVGNTAKTLYPSAGGSDDWAKSKLGIKYSYTIELPPDHNTRSRIVPLDQIKSVGEDFFPALKVFVDEVANTSL